MLSAQEKLKVMSILSEALIHGAYHRAPQKVSGTSGAYRKDEPFITSFRPDRTVSSKGTFERAIKSPSVLKELHKIRGLAINELLVSVQSTAQRLVVSSPKLTAVAVHLETSTEHMVANPKDKPTFVLVEMAVIAEFGIVTAIIADDK